MAPSGSRIILGTMRLHEAPRGAGDWADFLAEASRLGVDRLHSSTEYDSFPLLVEALGELRRRRPEIAFRHVVKLGAPQFDEAGFEPAALVERVRRYGELLGVECVDDVQWMWRHGLDDDARRVEAFRAALPAIEETAAALKRSGAIRRFLCFPYSLPFAFAAAGADATDGLVVYRNTQELDYDEALAAAAVAGKSSLIIRPLNAGKAVEAESRPPAELVAFALDAPGVEAAIVSTSSLAHLAELLSAAAR